MLLLQFFVWFTCMLLLANYEQKQQEYDRTEWIFGTWEIKSICYQDTVAIIPPLVTPDTKTYITFSDDKFAITEGDVTTLSGKYTIDRSVISFSEVRGSATFGGDTIVGKSIMRMLPDIMYVAPYNDSIQWMFTYPIVEEADGIQMIRIKED